MLIKWHAKFDLIILQLIFLEFDSIQPMAEDAGASLRYVDFFECGFSLVLSLSSWCVFDGVPDIFKDCKLISSI